MPLLIEEDDIFEVVVRYVDGSPILYFEEDEDLPDGGMEECFRFKHPNWSEQQSIMAGALSLDASGMPMADPYKYMDARIKTLLKSWTLKTEDGKPIPLTEKNIDRMNSSLVNYLSKKVDDHLSEDEHDDHPSLHDITTKASKRAL